jgi:hypothetical protein
MASLPLILPTLQMPPPPDVRLLIASSSYLWLAEHPRERQGNDEHTDGEDDPSDDHGAGSEEAAGCLAACADGGEP